MSVALSVATPVSAVPERPFGWVFPLRAAVLCRRLACALILILLCGLPGAFAQSAQSESDLMIARIRDAEKLLVNDARNDKLSPEQLRKMANFLAGNLTFAILHETGHALIADMSLPVLGGEEDAADTYATVAILQMGTIATRGAPESAANGWYGALDAAAKGWFYSNRNDRDQGAAFDYYDNHGLDAQRAYRIVCLMVGSDPDRFKSLAEDTKLPEERQDSCSADFGDARWSWVKALTPHYRATPELPRTNVSVVYGEAKGVLDVYRSFVESIQMSEITAGHLADAFLWRSPFAIEWQTCGEAAAHWQFKARKLLVCYELADEFARLYRDYGDLEIPVPNIRWPALPK
jgi:putative metallopeptidase DUF4344